MIKAVLFSAIVAVSFAKPQYVQPQYEYSKNLAAERYARILQLQNEIYPDGRYQYSYDTENGINAAEAGEQRPASNNNLGTFAQGHYRYTSPEGIPVQVDYTADENGYHPTGNNLPTSPPIPEPILRSVERNLAELQAQRAGDPYNRYNQYNRY